MNGTAIHAPDGPRRDPLTDALDALHEISLSDLVAEAPMMQRIDRKYVLPASEVPALLAATPALTQVLTIDGQRRFGYRSTYLDTDDHLSFRLAGQRRRRRFKVRTRAYLDTGTCWLEVKTRGRRGSNVKQRIPHEDAEFAPLDEEGRRFVDRELADAEVAVRSEHLRPALVTGYDRATLYLPESQGRATIDLELGWTLVGRHGDLSRDLDRPGVAIVETKAGSTPSDLDRLLWGLGHRPTCISKYGVGMAALHPALPRLKWHRAMERHLDLPRGRPPTGDAQDSHRERCA